MFTLRSHCAIFLRGLAATISLATLAGAGCASDKEGDAKDPYALAREDGQVTVTDIYRACSADDDCTLVGTSCNGCCGRDAIAGSLTSKYEAAQEQACSGYSGPICDCDLKPLTAKCSAGACEAVPNEPADSGATSDAGRSDASVDAGPSADRERECTDLNAKIAKETDALRTCKVDADCGKNLPTLGSCGCTHDLVGRADADIDALQALLTKREQYADIKACEPLAGDCSCPAVGGVACTEQRCAWVSVEPDNPCADLQGSFASVAELECGLTPDGVGLCHWSLSFTDSAFSWQHSDVGESGSYACKDGVISAHTGGGATYQGKIADDGSLTFEGVAYQRKP